MLQMEIINELELNTLSIQQIIIITLILICLTLFVIGVLRTNTTHIPVKQRIIVIIALSIMVIMTIINLIPS